MSSCNIAEGLSRTEQISILEQMLDEYGIPYKEVDGELEFIVGDTLVLTKYNTDDDLYDLASCLYLSLEE